MKRFLIFLGFSLLLSCNQKASAELLTKTVVSSSEKTQRDTINDTVSEFRKQLSQQAINIIDPSIRYTPDYVSITYPNGDVPANTGVCTDLIIRAYRKLGIGFAKRSPRGYENSF